MHTLVLVAAAGSATTGSLELPALGADIGLGVAVRGSRGFSKVPVHLSGFTGS